VKTLEEPPEHVKFIFCTTEAEKIPITILSRCQRFDFPPVDATSIVERLMQIVQAEGLTAEEEALRLLARRANGSLRDSQSLLEQLLSCGSQRITVTDVHAMLGTARSGQLDALVEQLSAGNVAGVLHEIDQAIREGVDAGQLGEQLLGYFRDLMAASVSCGPELMLHTMSADYPRLRELGERMGLESLLAMVQVLDQALGRMRYSTHVRTLLEVALVRMCQLGGLDELSQLVAQLRQGGIDGAAASKEPARLPAAAENTTGSEKKNQLPPAPLDGAAADLTAETVDSIWKEALAELGDMTADFARHAEQLVLAEKDRLVAHFRAGYSLHKEYCERPERRSKLEEALSRVAGRPIRLDVALLPADASSAGRPAPVPSARQRLREREQHPLVRRAMELFDAEVVRIDEPRGAATPRPAP
jgi:DNA polymerase-3 subunit gamma/tau